ncbi:hypothetical protein [Sorangium sp. So ce233]
MLLIIGETKSGKSKSADLVQHIATTHEHPYVCVLGTGQPAWCRQYSTVE